MWFWICLLNLRIPVLFPLFVVIFQWCHSKSCLATLILLFASDKSEELLRLIYFCVQFWNDDLQGRFFADLMPFVTLSFLELLFLESCNITGQLSLYSMIMTAAAFHYSIISITLSVNTRQTQFELNPSHICICRVDVIIMLIDTDQIKKSIIYLEPRWKSWWKKWQKWANLLNFYLI